MSEDKKTTKRVTITDNFAEITDYSGVAKITEDTLKGQISLYDVDDNVFAVVRKTEVTIQSVDK